MSDYRLTKPTINGKKSEVWYAVWRERGRSRRTSTGERDKVRAAQWLELFKDAKALPAGPWTIGAVFSSYVLSVNAPQARVSAKHIMPYFQHKQPYALKQGDIDGYIKDRKKVVSEATYATELRYLRAALNWAYREGHIDAPRPFKIPAGRSVRRRFFTQAEFDKMIAGCETLWLRMYMEIAIATASRPAKIYALKWGDIHTQSKMIYFAEGNATKRTRPVPINARLAWALGVAFQARQSEYIVERAGKRVSSLNKQFRQLTQRVGVQDAKLRDFRGTAASWALQRGAPISLVADLLADSVEVVERHYGHFSPTHIQSVTDLLG